MAEMEDRRQAVPLAQHGSDVRVVVRDDALRDDPHGNGHAAVVVVDGGDARALGYHPYDGDGGENRVTALTVVGSGAASSSCDKGNVIIKHINCISLNTMGHKFWQCRRWVVINALWAPMSQKMCSTCLQQRVIL